MGSLPMGREPTRLPCGTGPTLHGWIGRRAVVRVFSRTILRMQYEAAHMPSRFLTEPMRWPDRSRPGRRLAPLSMRRRIAGLATLPCGGRARQFAWPACGTDRFLGRALRHERRRVAGTQPGLIPHSCLVPPRFVTQGCHGRDEMPCRRSASRVESAKAVRKKRLTRL